jgi:putative membrane protein
MGQGAHEFLGTQGDEWDTQWDMFLALIGASVALTLSGLTASWRSAFGQARIPLSNSRLKGGVIGRTADCG